MCPFKKFYAQFPYCPRVIQTPKLVNMQIKACIVISQGQRLMDLFPLLYK